MSDDDRKTEPPLHLDMGFDEALRRYAQTKPEEVEPPPGKAKKRPKLKMLAPRVKTLEPRLKTIGQPQGKKD
jgi:hypothetical protein